ncbi:MAG: hypothetical protein M1381_09425 [Deltaproteobacteria bacterium]|nr:hypothetical protein [Deltaproteobacteria bacterium]MCL5792747.1 hypothetical protein [Deltaproteobacteria bacterium]
MYGHEGCRHEGYGRGIWESGHQHHRGAGCCGEERHGHEHGYGFSRRFRDELFPSRERLQKTLEWLKQEKSDLEKRITDLDALLKGSQS